jgi:F-type H+-transporting ATPase subunit b
LQEKVQKAQEVKDLAMTSLAQAVLDEKKEQWRAEGRQMLFDAKRVSVTEERLERGSLVCIQVRV